MLIGIVPDPERHRDWPQIRAFLEPAAKLGERDVLEPLEAVWAVYDPELIGCATACLKADNIGEVPLVGGTEFRRWIAFLDKKIGDWMRDEGMTAMRAFGRKGWLRFLAGWQSIELDDGSMAYERAL